ncbi:hypothetical protein [Streptomyces sp. HNM0574]|uniref:hypothetical protein n=1 Tax=Streptomyces sp. HNM0574 TaxID=2714954 RepID=UPI00146AB279|nr:hypothetical protein [Streptomyces sp. HNM0574]NLU68432.1 hypothetical protein [Streptomyces sp. HNM0574]
MKKSGVKRVINAIKVVRKGKGQPLTKDLKDVALIFLGVDEIKEAWGGEGVGRGQPAPVEPPLPMRTSAAGRAVALRT